MNGLDECTRYRNSNEMEMEPKNMTLIIVQEAYFIRIASSVLREYISGIFED